MLAVVVIAALAYWLGAAQPFAKKAAPSASDKVGTPAPASIQTKPSPATAPEVNTEDAPAASTATAENGDILYTNTAHGFTLTLPKNWKDFHVENKKTDSGYEYLSFELPSARGGYGSIFSISFHTLAGWKAMQAEGSPMPSRLAGKGDSVFGYTFAQDDTGYSGYPEPVPGLIYKGPIFEAEEMIIPSFRLL